jgi:hypothetical protein
MQLRRVCSIRDEVFRNNKTKDIVFDKVAEGFIKRVDKQTSLYSIYNKDIKSQCWTYNKNTNRERYCNVHITIRELDIDIYLHSHVVSMYLYNGIILLAKNLEVRHLCNNKCCCNPSHLDIGTSSRNRRDEYLHRLCCKAKINGYLNDMTFIENIRWLYWGRGYTVYAIKDIVYEELNRKINIGFIDNIINFDRWDVTEF